MTKTRKSLRNAAVCATAALMAGTLFASQLVSIPGKGETVSSASGEAAITDVTGKVASDFTSAFDPNTVRKLPEGIDGARELSVIVQTTDNALLSAFEAQGGKFDDIADFASSAAGAKVSSAIEAANGSALKRLKDAGVRYTRGVSYDTLIGGFEIVIKAKEYDKIVSALAGTDAAAYISEEYAPAEAKLVENVVNVYETGIFDSHDSEFQGEGTLIAVLDTGLDYTHSVFDPDVFEAEVDASQYAMTRSRLEGIVDGLEAAKYTRGLSAEKVFVNNKVPYAYDYADKDTDVYPLDSEHGTHVSGVILGDNRGSLKNKEGDPEIVGVAPKAQLAMMKVFSDTSSGAKQSWMLAALEDCVKLGVDVVNMSLGMSAGFTEETGDDFRESVYEKVGRAGISLVCAASNDYNSTFGSEKNGNLGLTSNPDSATVGSPSTYESALSVASISGVKTPYLKYGKTIMYFTEASDAASEPKDFVNDILPFGVESKEFEYVTVPGIGRNADYTGLDVTGKIALVRRGSNTFEEKARIAIEDYHAAGVIIYNNVSGDISMTVGSTDGAVCSISQDNGEILAAHPTGKLMISRKQIAGPFMSAFSSWGPTPDLRIKPEITAHGGEILSAVPGQDYDRLSGTSMASPNQAGVTAIVRQYVKQKFGLNGNDEATRLKVNAMVNQLMMSTADIAYNINGLPYSVRKQGSGLANLAEATSTPAYITTYERNDGDLYGNGASRFLVDDAHEMDKAKIEYGDDRNKTGVYDLVFSVNNISDEALSYEVGAIVMTEGVSETKTARGDTTVTEEGYLLSPKFSVVKAEGDGTFNGKSVSVKGNGKLTVTVRIELTDSDKQYLDRSFANGMYVEGFVTLNAKNKKAVSLNVPYLAFYGDWTKAPIFDLDYFDTNKDELNNAIDQDDKTMADAIATRAIGGLYDDYIVYLGAYPYRQNPSATPIAADRKYIALSNQRSSANSVNSVWAGMLRAAKRVVTTITDTSTGEVVWSKEDWNQRKSYNYGGAISSSTIDIGFSVPEHDLKNNTQYNVRVEAFVDYGDENEQKNVKNVFEFPFVTDFQAPVVTDVDFYTEYDRTSQKTKIFARLSIFDNHYTCASFFGKIVYNTDPAENARYVMKTFSPYPTPVYSSFNSTTEVTYELTDYMSQLTDSVNPNTFIVQLVDYAQNISTFEIRIPDNAQLVNFTGNKIKTDEATGRQTVTLSPNEIYNLDPEVWPSDQWAAGLTYRVNDSSVARIVNGKLLAVTSGNTQLTVTNASGKLLSTLDVVVLSETDEGYVKYTSPQVDVFRLTGYTTDKAFYYLSNDDRDIGITGSKMKFSANATSYDLSMFPSEQVTLEYFLVAYSDAKVTFRSNNPEIVTVSENGQITAVAEGFGSVSVSVSVNGQSTLFDATVSVTVKNPYERNGPYLMGYRGLGGTVDIGKDVGENHGFTQVYQYAFSHYDYIPKDLNAGDVIDEEDPYYSKIWYLGENETVEKVIIPEGVEIIGAYAFAGMTGLKEVVLPSTLKQISTGAFYNCTNLQTVTGLKYVKFINQDAFYNTRLAQVDLSGIIAIGNNAFRGTQIVVLSLPATAQSIGTYAFAECTGLQQLSVAASNVKLGAGAFAGCTSLSTVTTINAYAIPEGLFEHCRALTNVTVGAAVESIDRNAFSGTSVSQLSVAAGNRTFEASADGKVLYRANAEEGVKEILYALPTLSGTYTDAAATKVGASAFSGIENLTGVSLPNVDEIGENAFYDCERLSTVKLGNISAIPEYAFFNTGVTSFDFKGIETIGSYAFSGSRLRTVTLPANVEVGLAAFEVCPNLTSVTVGAGAKIGAYAFTGAGTSYYPLYRYTVRFSDGSTSDMYKVGYYAVSMLTTLNLGADVELGDNAFSYNPRLSTVTLGDNVKIGSSAFFFCTSLSSVNLSKVQSIGDYAFAGVPNSLIALDDDGVTTYSSDFDEPQSNKLTSVDLSSATSIGEHAFALNTKLTSVKLGAGLKEIPAYAFYGTVISDIDLSHVEKIGAYAFGASITDSFFDNDVPYESRFSASTLDLGAATEIGAYAFSGSNKLTRLTLNAGVTEEAGEEGGDALTTAVLNIGEGAFSGSTLLAEVKHLNMAKTIGGHAFENASLSGVLDLSSAAEIGELAFAGNKFTSVKFGDALVAIGDNPFAGSLLSPFGYAVDVYFPEGSDHVVGTEFVDTYDISETVVVIDGALYRKIESASGDLRGVRTVNGKKQYYLYALELISYPAASEKEEFKVADGTVRIAAGAFMNAKLARVELPVSLKAIGDKAFYGCSDLKIVVFNSLQAPILEEQYDATYADTRKNLPGPLTSSNNPDLGIIKYTMWYPSSVNYFYGANFDNYIGRAGGDIVIVRPRNGAGYENFIYEQYFGPVIDGAVAPDEATAAVIRAITLLPDADFTKEDLAQIRPLVNRARSLYNAISSDEQRALVTNYNKLTETEAYMEWLNLNGSDNPLPPADDGGSDTLTIALSVVGGVLGAALIVAGVFLYFRGKKKNDDQNDAAE